MKSVLCYLGILVLLVLGALPPVLRTFYHPEEENKEDMIIESAILVCTNDNYMTTTSYEGDEVKKIAIKKIITTNLEDGENVEQEPNTEQKEDEDIKIESVKTEMDLLFDTLKENEDVVYNTVDNSEVIGLDFSISKYETVDLTNLVKSKEDQMKYFQSLDLTCSIRK